MSTSLERHALLHDLWGLAVGTHGYDKAQWHRLQAMLDAGDCAQAERDLAEALAALRNIAIDGVTAGANPQKDGTLSAPLWHIHCRLCDARWSLQVWKRPTEHPAGKCLLAALPPLPESSR